MKQTYFCIFQDGSGIFAVGHTAIEAKQDLKNWIDPQDDPKIIDSYYSPVHGDFYILPCTKAVYNIVLKEGGMIDYIADIESQTVYLPEELEIPVLQKFEIRGYEALEKIVKPGNKSSGRLNMPKSWEGCRVLVVRLDDLGADDNIEP